jgi:hypothetical protein
MMKPLQRILLAAIGFLTTIGSALAGVLPYRPNSTITIAQVPNPRLTIVNNLWGGYTNTTDAPNWGLLVWNSLMVYQDAIGQIAWVILFAIPFIMMWIVQADTMLPGIIGILFSFYVFAKLPAQYVMFGIGALCISIAACIWSLLKRAY